MGQPAPGGKSKTRGRKSAGLPKPDALARRIADLAFEKKAESVLILDLRGLSSACDFFVLASGLSEVQVKAVAEHIEETLAKESVRPWHVEGRHHRRWILLDYVDVVVHLFHKDARDFYRLENLWADAPREHVTDESPADRAAGERPSAGPGGESADAGGTDAGADQRPAPARKEASEDPESGTQPKRRKAPSGTREKRHPQEE